MTDLRFAPWMPQAQIDRIDVHIKPDHTMLEWGSGGSTIYFAPKVTRYISIEHDPAWAVNLRDRVSSNTEYHQVPPSVPLPVPAARNSTITPEKYEELKAEFAHLTEHSIRRYWQFREYVDYIDTVDIRRIDTILVDGRARGMCAVRALKYMSDSSRLFLDDFFTRFEEYTDSFYEYFELVEKVERMAVLKERG